MKPAYYQALITEFLQADPRAVLGELAENHGFALELQQRDAWREQIEVMKRSVAHVDDGHILFEFVVPRMGKRCDVVLVIQGLIIVVEFKVGSATFDRHAIEQVHDYALDLKNFHRGSHAVPIVPVLVATRATCSSKPVLTWAVDGVAEPLLADAQGLHKVLGHVVATRGGARIDFDCWLSSGYRPTPTIIEAAQSLYRDHNVSEIARSDAGAHNLGITSDSIAQIIERSKAERRKAICLVTGVPGAGNTNGHVV